MKSISNKEWFSVRVDLNKEFNLATLYQYFYDYIIGTTEKDNKLIFYFEKDNQRVIKNLIINKFESYKLKMKNIKYENWHNTYKEYFKPIHINKNLMIIPEWHKAQNDSIEYIKIIPGMAFGTGTHETTQLVISNLANYIYKGCTVLDLGAGSGILSIAAFKYGASEITAVEYDKDCKDNFLENFQLNNISNNYTLLFQDVLSFKDYNYDFILANINKNIILELLPRIKKYKTNKSKIILSGLLIDDRNDVINLIEKLKFNLLEEFIKGEWICFIID